MARAPACLPALHWLAAALTALLLAGCGGGGDDDPPDQQAPTPNCAARPLECR